MGNKQRGKNSTGGGRAKVQPRDPNSFGVEVGPVASQVSLLDRILGKRRLLNDYEGRRATEVRGRAGRGPLTGTDLEWAKKLGVSIGEGYDEPEVTEGAQPWGPLPLKPPGRSASSA